MPLESTSYISGLEPSYPVSTDLVGQADDHIRLLKSVLKNTFPNINGPVTASEESLNQASPVGLIALWYGSSSSVPVGWALCNGQTIAKSDGSGDITTPNLVDKLPIGAGTLAAQGVAAGSTTTKGTTDASGAHSHTVSGGAHSHTGTVAGTALTINQIPSHDHGLSNAPLTVDAGGSKTFDSISTTGTENAAYIGNRGGGEAHTHGLTIDSSSSHEHTVSDSATHTHTITFSVLPPVLGLHYVMKI